MSEPLPPGHPFPADRELTVPGTDGTPLAVRLYNPDGAQRRTLLVLHGAAEHSGRYTHVASHFVHRGWQVVVPDLRGHGRSGGTPTHLVEFDDYVRDALRLREKFAPDPARTAILSHSTGGLITVRLLQKHPEAASAAVLISPLLGVGVDIPRRKLALAKLMSKMSPEFRFESTVPPEDTTRNVQLLAERAGDPLMRPSVTAGWFFAIRAALRQAWDEAPHLTHPLLILQAGQDRLVSPVATQDWVKRLSPGDHQFDEYPEHFHELLNEPDWQQTLERVGNWLGERVTAG